jgi:hypothetical protein
VIVRFAIGRPFDLIMIAGLIRSTVLRDHADLLIMVRGESHEFNGDSYSIAREFPCPILSF